MIARVLRAAAMVVFLVLACRAVAQPRQLPAGASPAMPKASPSLSGQPETHGWLVREAPRFRSSDPSRWQVYHIPPRRATSIADGIAHGSRDGSLRPSKSLAQRPQAIAAWDQTAWFIFEPGPVDPKRTDREFVRQVLSISAVTRGPDLWGDSPADRFTSETSLPGRGRLAGFVGTARGPIALLDQSLEAGAPPWAIKLLFGDHWVELPLPQEIAAGARLSIVADAEGVSVIAPGRVLIDWWRGRFRDAAEAPAGSPPTIEWTRSPRGLSMELTSDEASTAQYAILDRALFAITPGRAGLNWSQARILECDVGGARLVSTLIGPGGQLGVIPMEGLGRLFLVWDSANSQEVSTQPLTVAEVSAWTGRTLYAGSAQMTKPLGKPDLVMLALGLFLVIASVTLFVFRPDAGQDVNIPDGLAIADPLRRFLATAFDAFIALMIASRLVDLPISAALSVDAMVAGQTLWLLVATLITGFLTCTASEAMFSRSIGKAILGCIVIQLPPSPVPGAPFDGAAPVGLASAAIRNAIKWVMPPVVILTFLEPSGRHRAEAITRTAVVVPNPPEDDPGTGDGGD